MDTTALRSVAAVAAVVALAACGASTAPDNAAVCKAFSAGQSHAEVTAQGVVVREFRRSRRPRKSSRRISDALSSDCDVIVRVEANVDFTGTFALRRGQTVEVRGEYEYYASGGRDPLDA